MPPEVRFGTITDPESSTYRKADIYALGLLWMCIFDHSLNPIGVLDQVRSQMVSYIIMNTPGVNPANYYTAVSPTQKQILYNTWKQKFAQPLIDLFTIQHGDPKKEMALTKLAHKMLSFDSDQRIGTIDDVINEVNRL
jgi:hypothetical protein